MSLVDAVRDLTADGMTAQTIARQLGVTSSHVHRLRREARDLYGADCMTVTPKSRYFDFLTDDEFDTFLRGMEQTEREFEEQLRDVAEQLANQREGVRKLHREREARRRRAANHG